MDTTYASHGTCYTMSCFKYIIILVLLSDKHMRKGSHHPQCSQCVAHYQEAVNRTEYVAYGYW